MMRICSGRGNCNLKEGGGVKEGGFELIAAVEMKEHTKSQSQREMKKIKRIIILELNSSSDNKLKLE